MNQVLSPTERRALRRAVGLLEINRGRFAVSVLAGSGALVSAIALSGVAAWLIARAAGMPDVAALGVAPVMVRLFGVSRPVLRYCERLASHDTALRGMSALRTTLYRILAASRTDTLASLHRGDVLARVGTDVDAVGDLVVRGLLPLAVAAVVAVSASVALALVHWPAGLVLASCLLLAGVVGPLMTIRSARAAERARAQQRTDLSATVLTMVEGGSELSVMGRTGQLLEHLDSLEGHLARSKDQAARPAAVAAAVDVAALGLAVVGCVAVGLPAAATGSLGGVWLAVVVLVPLSSFEATSALGPACVQLVASASAAERIIALVDKAEESSTALTSVPAGPGAPCTPAGPVLRARDLAVGWPGGPVVAQGIDLDLAPGRRVAVVGPSGIGKTTLLLTLAGLLPPVHGSVTLDGASPWDAPRSDVASRLTLTAEDAHIFATTVLENLRVARGSVTPDEAAGLLERAGLRTWLRSLPHGLSTQLGSNATTISGGERRRLLLARALASPAPLLLLDEPAEHLDVATGDALVTDLLDAARTGSEERGVLLVTHRLSALGCADEVLVMGPQKQAADDGQPGPARVLARGSHEDLRDHHEAYAWALAQEETRTETRA